MDTDNPEQNSGSLLERLFRAVYMRVRQNFGAQATHDQIERVTNKILAEMREPTTVSWEHAAPTTTQAVKRTAMLHRVVRLAGHVAEMRDPQIVHVRASGNDDGEIVQVDTTCAKIEGRDGSSIWSLDVTGAELITKLQGAGSAFVEFLGLVIAMPATIDMKRPDTSVGSARSDFLLHILDVRAATSAFDLLGATLEERLRGQALLDDLRRRSVAPFDYIRETAIKNLQIHGLDKLTVLRDVIDFTVLQSVAGGHVGHAPGTLSVLVIGPPGRGKKLPHVVAEMLNAVSSPMSAACASPAGWVGASTHGKGRWTSKPGALPRAAGGVAMMQDAHSIPSAKLRELVHILAEVIEDGKVRSSVAGGREWPAQTSLLIDMNTEEQAFGTSSSRMTLTSYAPILSRLDLIAWIERDDAATWSIAEQLYGTTTRTAAPDSEAWRRDLQLLVAALRDAHPVVALGGVEEQMRAAHRALSDQKYYGGLPNAGDYPARLSVSYRRLVTAHARACDRSIATVDDLKAVGKFIMMKLDALKRIVSSDRAASKPSLEAFLTTLAGKAVSPATVAAEYKVATDITVDERTARRHLLRVAQKVAHNTYQLPGSGKPSPASVDVPVSECPSVRATPTTARSAKPKTVNRTNGHAASRRKASGRTA